MTFRARLRLISVLAVAVALIASSAVLFVRVRSSLHGRVDTQLRQQATYLRAHASTAQDAQRLPPAPVGGVRSYVQFVSSAGAVLASAQPTGTGPGGRGGAIPGGDAPVAAPPTGAPQSGPAGQPPARPLAPQGQGFEQPSQTPSAPLRITSLTRSVLGHPGTERFDDQRSSDGHLRVLTVGLSDGGVAQIALSLADADTTVADLRTILLVAFAAALVLAVFLAFFVTRFAARPIRTLERAIDAVANDAGPDLTVRVPDTSGDEIGRLGRCFNGMLDRLSDARESQLRLVEDASHELRTPLTSIMTNMEVLEEAPDLPARHRELVSDVTAQVRELSKLTQALVELAQGDAGEGMDDVVRVDLSDLAAECVQRSQRVARDRVAVTLVEEAAAQPGQVLASVARLRTALDNLLSNAVKFAPDHSRVTVTVSGTTVTVADEGPGISAQDRRHVFERFYRAVQTKNTPGAGLGLSIVVAVTEELGGAVTITDGIDGRGVAFVMTLPAAEPDTTPVPDVFARD